MARVELDGVPETTLWTLYHRALEAQRPDTVLEDPVAVGLLDRLDYPFAERFGAGAGGIPQWQALRARTFDGEVRRFAAAHPGGTVVALGEGLETQFWRVDDGRVRWVSVDLPETIALRAEVLPPAVAGRQASVAASALDVDAWAGAVDEPARGVLVTAQGLLMYFSRAEVHGLIGACAARFGGGWMVFDAIPRWLAQRSARAGGLSRSDGSGGGYKAPPWDWGIDASEEAALRALPGVAELEAVRVGRGRGAVQGVVLPAVASAASVRRRLLSIWRLTFA
ncbi:MAG TPA: class I SAM-dependent methyltransferase [Baekduia sp.]